MRDPRDAEETWRRLLAAHTRVMVRCRHERLAEGYIDDLPYAGPLPTRRCRDCDSGELVRGR